MFGSLKIAILPLILFALYSVSGFWLLPAWIQQQVEKASNRDAFDQAHFEGIHFNPYTFRLEFTGVSASGKDKQWTFEFDAAVIDLSVHSLFAWQPILDAVEVDSPKLAIHRSNDFADFGVDTSSLPGAESGGKGILRQLEISRFSVSNGSFHYTDKTVKTTYEERFHPIRFVLRDLSAEAESPSKIRFTAKTETEGELKWESELSRAPFTMDGKFQLSDLKVERLSPYYAHFWAFR